jgi:hypothetical protein
VLTPATHIISANIILILTLIPARTSRSRSTWGSGVKRQRLADGMNVED